MLKILLKFSLMKKLRLENILIQQLRHGEY